MVFLYSLDKAIFANKLKKSSTTLPKKSTNYDSPIKTNTSQDAVGKQQGATITHEQILHMDLRGNPPISHEVITEWILSKSPKNSIFRQTSEPIGKIFLDAAIRAQVNVFYLVAHAAHETGWGTSSITKNKYNFFGIGAFDSSPSASAKSFSDGVKGGITYGAMWISENYINNPKYQQNTLHKMLYHDTHAYATDKRRGDPGARLEDNTRDPLSWADKIANIMLHSPLNENWDKMSFASQGFLGYSPSAFGQFYSSQYSYQQIYKKEGKKGPGGYHNKPVTKEMLGFGTKPTKVPAHYYEDDFTSMPHRYIQSSYFIRIGDSRFMIPPTKIKVSEESDVTKFYSVRNKESIKVQTGRKTRVIELSLMFADFNQINGYKVESPFGSEQPYYMDGLRSLLAQIKTMPFLPIENELLNYVYDVYAVAVLSCDVTTVDGFPNVMKADLVLLEFDPEVYLNKPLWTYDYHFMWPLFRWHYQRLLNGRTKKSDVLAPFIGDAKIHFWHIDEKALMNHEEEVIKQNSLNKKNLDKYLTWWDINAKLTSEKDESNMFIPFEMPHDYEILSIQASLANTYTPLTPALLGRPAYQYFGSQDTRFHLLLFTDKREVVKSFLMLKNKMDRFAREYRDRLASSFLRVENNFINMLGVNSVMIESIHSETIEGYPDGYYISISLISFDRTQSKDETLTYLDTVDIQSLVHKKDNKNLASAMAGNDLSTFDNNIVHEVRAEQLLNELELYPDLDLPTYKEVNEAIQKINSYYKKKKLPTLPITKLVGPKNAKYVDPDFYFSYPTLQDIVKKIENQVSNPVAKKIASYYDVDVSTELKELQKVKAEDLFNARTIQMLNKESKDKKLGEKYRQLGFHAPFQLNAKLDEYRKTILDPEKYKKRFWMLSWRGEGGQWVTTEMDVFGEKDREWKLAYYEKQKVVAKVKNLKEKGYFSGMLHDMYMYDRRGTMMRAFPTYVFVIIDEGRYINVRKLWDKYYTYHSIIDIAVHMSRKNPIHTAYIQLSNVYGTLTQKRLYALKRKANLSTSLAKLVLKQFISNVTERELYERAVINDSIELMAGARVHLRLGYGGSASQLPPVFNGVITEINNGDIVTLVAQSYGFELTNEIPAKPGEVNDVFEQGIESTDIFRYYMTERKANFTWAWRNSADPENYQSAYGINHFGFLRIRDKQGIEDMFSGLYWDHEKEINAEDYDIMKNIYSSADYTKIGADEGSINETNVRMELEGKSPWDVFRVLERVTPEYVVYPHIHQFHYTLFFGKPWWDVQCGYILPQIDNPSAKYGRKISDYVELSKPFSQLHVYSSYSDILSNNIKAVGSDLITGVIPKYQLGDDDETYETVWADYYIYGSFQRVKTIDTTLMDDTPFVPTFLEKLGTQIVNIFNSRTKYQKHSIRFAQNVIAESFRDMYQGELVVIGDPSVKPYDVIYLDDFYARMNGACEVGEVIHHFGLETGFITTIKPDLSVVLHPDPENQIASWDGDPDKISQNFFRMSHIITYGALHTWQYYAMFKVAMIATDLMVFKSMLSIAKFVAPRKALRAFRLAQGTKYARLVGKGMQIPRGIKIAHSLVSGAKILRNGITAIRGFLGASAMASASVPGVGWAAAAVQILIIFGTEFLLNAIENMFVQRHNNVIKIFPLYRLGIPYVAGVNGHRQLIPGWMDDGGGRPVQVSYNSVPKKDPKKASEMLPEKIASIVEIGSINTHESYLRDASKYAEGVDWEMVFRGLSSNVLKKEGIFAFPIALGSERKSFSGFESRITSKFRTSKRPDHMGLDLGRGAPSKSNDWVVAFADGVVMYAGAANGYGTLVIIRHEFKRDNGSVFVFFSAYGHMTKSKIKVNTGEKVKAGQIIGVMGNEGDSQGIHLHFEIIYPKNEDEARKLSPGSGAKTWVYKGHKQNRENVMYIDPLKFIQGIANVKPGLIKIVEYKG